jgi:hypothetical protein
LEGTTKTPSRVESANLFAIVTLISNLLKKAMIHTICDGNFEGWKATL